MSRQAALAGSASAASSATGTLTTQLATFVPSPERTYAIEADPRVYLIEDEDRVYAIEAERRVLEVT
jgi:hypothetical protein